MKIFKLFLIACLFTLTAQAQKKYELASPDGKLKTNITAGKQLTYDIVFNGQQVIAAAPISITLENGEVWGENDKPTSAKRKSVSEKVASPFYRAAEMEDNYNQLVLSFKGNWSVEFRAYNDGIAYRFVSKSKKPFNIANEEVNFQFNSDAKGTVPFVIRGSDGNYESQFFNSFENQYTVKNLSELNKKRLIFLPALVEVENNVKVCFTETDLNNYPGLYLSTEKGENLLSGVFAKYPKELEQGGHNNLQMKIKSREDYIAKVNGPRSFPWRIAVVSDKDIDIANSNLSYLLAAPSKVADTSWIKPGKVAWEWWNCWNIDGVDFNTGVNNATYKAYIDFAGRNGIEYVILDEGWAVNRKADLMQVVPEIDLKGLIAYAAERNVGIILWAGYYAFERDMENVCKHYSEMGVKGFKVDFMDRDDQMMTDFNFRAAEMCAKYKLLLDLHGTHKPAGLNRTYPNVLNFEGVYGLEQAKWEDPKILDHVTYNTQLPFIRQVSGPMDYTQGAMLNTIKGQYKPNYYEPMSQGTRCNQLALYVILESPLNMLCDNPSNYEREPECTKFISAIPTTWDETKVIDGKLGEYVVTARRKGDTWYIGGITNWHGRTIDVDLSFLGGKTMKGELFRDGVNAWKKARDYKREEKSVNTAEKFKIYMAPGGGFTLKLQ